MVDPIEMLIARIMDGQPVRHASVKMIQELKARAEAAEIVLAWELNILEQEVKPIIKPSKREWLETRIKRIRAALEVKP
jgi:hypothetical protein